MGVFPCRLLLDLPNWLGDFIHALPAVKGLLQANQKGHSILLLPGNHVALARGLGATLLPRPGKAGVGFARALPPVDVALTFRHSTRAKVLLWALGAERVLASQGRGARLLGLETFRVNRKRHQRHDVDGALVRLSLAPVNGEPVFLSLGPACSRKPGLVVLLPGSHNYPQKRYPPSAFAEVARQVRSWGLDVWVVVGPNDRRLGAWLAQQGGAELFPPEASLLEVARFLAEAQLAIGNDSGLTHLASALGCPTLALFGPTSLARTAPIPGWVLQAPDFSRQGWVGLPPVKVVATILRLLRGDLREARMMPKIELGGGPLAQLAEQGTLNP